MIHSVFHRLNDRLNQLGVVITNGVGTMWCALVFAGLAFVSLPTVLGQGTQAIISWIAQTFLQLVLLSIIIVGQNAQAAAVEARDIETHDTVMQSHAELHQRLGAIQAALAIPTGEPNDHQG